MVKRNLGSLSGTSHADEVVTIIRNRGLAKGQIGIEIRNWGLPTYPADLWQNADDGSGVVTADPNFDPSFVPFYAEGIKKTLAWTRAWIAEYQRLQAVHGDVPDPAAFWMDYENRITVGPRWTAQWADIKADPRWATEIVTFDGRTWAEVVQDEGIPDPISPGAGSVVNRDHTIAVRPFLLESMSRAMQVAFFDPLESAFPNLRTANWQTTHDGLHLAAEDADFRYSAVTGGTHQSPVLYGGSPADQAAQYPLEVQPGQFSGRPYAPWIEMAGESGIDASNIDDIFRWTVRQSIVDGVDDLLLYGDDVSGAGLVQTNWDLTVEAIDRAEAAAFGIWNALYGELDVSNKAPQTYTKHPSEVRAATMSFRHKLSIGDELSGTPTVTVSPSGPTISGVAIASAAVQGEYINADAKEAVQFTISGGSDGTSYRLVVQCDTVGGETLIGLADISVEDEA